MSAFYYVATKVLENIASEMNTLEKTFLESVTSLKMMTIRKTDGWEILRIHKSLGCKNEKDEASG